MGVEIAFWYFVGSSDATLMIDLTNSVGTQSTELTKLVLDRANKLETAQITENVGRNKVLLDALESIQNRLLKFVSDLDGDREANFLNLIETNVRTNNTLLGSIFQTLADYFNDKQ
jgi:hypothetical protein